jgi:hypothetical protein
MMSGSPKRRKGAGRLQSQRRSFKLHHYRLPRMIALQGGIEFSPATA